MIAIEIKEIKNFMEELLLSEKYDQLLLDKAEVFTAFLLEISGKRNRGWYDAEQWQRMEEVADSDVSWMTWKECRPLIMHHIKGKRPPERMCISLRLRQKQAAGLMEGSQAQSVYRECRPGFLLQVRYDRGVLQVVTGISFNMFTMDKTAEQIWDEIVIKSLEKRGFCLPNHK